MLHSLVIALGMARAQSLRLYRWWGAGFHLPQATRLYLFLFLSALIVSHQKLASYWKSLSDPVIDLLLYIAVGFLTAFSISLGGHVATDKRGYRWTFYISGVLLFIFITAAGVRNYRSALATETPKQIVMDAVTEANGHTDTAIDKANAHTDKEVSTVRDDLRKATEHSDQQIASVQKNLNDATQGLTGVISSAVKDLGSEISKVGKPDPPERPRLRFSLWGDNGNVDIIKSPLLVQPIRPNKDGVFDVDFAFSNVSGAQASKIDLWVYVCSECTFAKEPSGFDKPSGIDEHVRHHLYPGYLNAGVSMEKTSVTIKTARSLTYFDIGFRYSCETCGAMSELQTLKLLVTPAL